MRGELSKKSKYYLTKNRFYELKYFCLQYKDWKLYLDSIDCGTHSRALTPYPRSTDVHSLVEEVAIRRDFYERRIALVESICKSTDPYIWRYLLKAVTEEVSYTYLKTYMNIPCGKDYYYDRYRKLFWLLDEECHRIF